MTTTLMALCLSLMANLLFAGEEKLSLEYDGKSVIRTKSFSLFGSCIRHLPVKLTADPFLKATMKYESCEMGWFTVEVNASENGNYPLSVTQKAANGTNYEWKAILRLFEFKVEAEFAQHGRALLDVKGSYLFAKTYYSFTVYDIHEPKLPKLLHTISPDDANHTKDRVLTVLYSSAYMYVYRAKAQVDRDTGENVYIDIYDLSQGANSEPLVRGLTSSLAYSYDQLYDSVYHGFQDNTLLPLEVMETPTALYGMGVDCGSHKWRKQCTGGILFGLDISNPLAPKELSYEFRKRKPTDRVWYETATFVGPYAVSFTRDDIDAAIVVHKVAPGLSEWPIVNTFRVPLDIKSDWGYARTMLMPWIRNLDVPEEALQVVVGEQLIRLNLSANPTFSSTTLVAPPGCTLSEYCNPHHYKAVSKDFFFYHNEYNGLSYEFLDTPMYRSNYRDGYGGKVGKLEGYTSWEAKDGYIYSSGDHGMTVFSCLPGYKC